MKYIFLSFFLMYPTFLPAEISVRWRNDKNAFSHRLWDPVPHVPRSRLETGREYLQKNLFSVIVDFVFRCSSVNTEHFTYCESDFLCISKVVREVRYEVFRRARSFYFLSFQVQIFTEIVNTAVFRGARVNRALFRTSRFTTDDLSSRVRI